MRSILKKRNMDSAANGSEAGSNSTTSPVENSLGDRSDQSSSGNSTPTPKFITFSEEINHQIEERYNRTMQKLGASIADTTLARDLEITFAQEKIETAKSRIQKILNDLRKIDSKYDDNEYIENIRTDCFKQLDENFQNYLLDLLDKSKFTTKEDGENFSKLVFEIAETAIARSDLPVLERAVQKRITIGSEIIPCITTDQNKKLLIEAIEKDQFDMADFLLKREEISRLITTLENKYSLSFPDKISSEDKNYVLAFLTIDESATEESVQKKLSKIDELALSEKMKSRIDDIFKMQIPEIERIEKIRRVEKFIATANGQYGISAEHKKELQAHVDETKSKILHSKDIKIAKKTIGTGVSWEKAPYSLANVDNQYIEAAIKAIKPDLGFCKEKQQAAALLHAKCKVLEAEHSKFAPIEKQLMILQKKLEYQKVLYEIRIKNEKQYKGISFFQLEKNSSASAKLAETNRMLERLGVLETYNKEKDAGNKQRPAPFNSAKASQNGELGKLVHELRAVEENLCIMQPEPVAAFRF